MNKVIRNREHGEERAFYGATDTRFEHCLIRGDEDGESAFKECRRISLSECELSLRYPLWHVDGAAIDRCVMTDTCRAPMWYCKDVNVTDTEISGVKAVRECEGITLRNSRIVSEEFGWKSRGIAAYDCYIEGEYMFLDCTDLMLENVKIKGKYSFQYVKNAVIRNCVLDTKDAFWHGENITVYDSVVSGEYLGWYSKNLKLVRCSILGTQPLCYADGLVLEDCTMTDCDLSFERSNVIATVIGHIDSVKNPGGGSITASHVGEVISEQFEGRKSETLLITSQPFPEKRLI